MVGVGKMEEKCDERKKGLGYGWMFGSMACRERDSCSIWQNEVKEIRERYGRHGLIDE